MKFSDGFGRLVFRALALFGQRKTQKRQNTNAMIVFLGFTMVYIIGKRAARNKEKPTTLPSIYINVTLYIHAW